MKEQRGGFLISGSWLRTWGFTLRLCAKRSLAFVAVKDRVCAKSPRSAKTQSSAKPQTRNRPLILSASGRLIPTSGEPAAVRRHLRPC